MNVIAPVVFVHGLFHTFAHLRDQHFPASNRVLIPDLLGYGVYAGAPTAIDLHAQVEHVIAEMDRGGVAQAHLVGHSMGGVIAVLLARRYGERVASIINVEGNFTLSDAFWASKIAELLPAEVSALLDGYRCDVAGWLQAAGIEPTPPRVASARLMFESQPAATVQAMTKSIIRETAGPEYLRAVQRVFDAGVEMHLLAGERSRGDWNVPDFVLRQAASLTLQPCTGHMMPLEDPEDFLNIVRHIVECQRPC